MLFWLATQVALNLDKVRQKLCRSSSSNHTPSQYPVNTHSIMCRGKSVSSRPNCISNVSESLPLLLLLLLLPVIQSNKTIRLAVRTKADRHTSYCIEKYSRDDGVEWGARQGCPPHPYSPLSWPSARPPVHQPIPLHYTLLLTSLQYNVYTTMFAKLRNVYSIGLVLECISWVGVRQEQRGVPQ